MIGEKYYAVIDRHGLPHGIAHVRWLMCHLAAACDEGQPERAPHVVVEVAVTKVEEQKR